LHDLPPFRLLSFLRAAVVCPVLAGCQTVNNIQINTGIGKLVSANSQVVAGQLTSLIPGDTTIGSVTSFSGVTSTINPGTVAVDNILGGWPTYFVSYNDEMPAMWTINWSHPPVCISQTTPYPPLENPFVEEIEFTPNRYSNPTIGLVCLTNDPTHLNFVDTNISPQFSLDDTTPATIQIASLIPIAAAPQTRTYVYLLPH
jgi:hypothetical protein